MLETEYMKDDEFVEMAHEILKKFGSHQKNLMTDGLVYEDDIIEIKENYNGLDLEIERKVIHDNEHPELRVSNPVTMTSKGSIIRHHDEHCYLVPHMKSILGIENENEATTGVKP